MGYLTVAAEILTQWMTRAYKENQEVCGTNESLTTAFCDVFLDEIFWEVRDSPPNILQQFSNMSLEQWWSRYAPNIPFGSGPYFHNFDKNNNSQLISYYGATKTTIIEKSDNLLALILNIETAL